MKIISNIFYTIFITLLLAVALLFLVPLLPIDSSIELRIVESGSMEPAIKTGALVLIMPTSHYQVGDIVTFETKAAEVPTTHRITQISEENGQSVFTTKGDANEEADTDTVLASNILGKVRIAVPYAGFILDFARQPLGFALLIVLPAFMIIVSEIEKIWREIRKRRNDKNDGAPLTVVRDMTPTPEVEVREIVRMIEIGRPVFSYETITRVRRLTVRSYEPPVRGGLALGELALSICVVVTSVCFASMSFVGSTVSYFNDTESSVQNLLRATALDFNVTADGETYNFSGTDLVDDDGVLITMVAGEDDSAEARYTVVTEKMGGSDLFCNAINTSSNVPITYDGPLLLLSATEVTFDDPWEMSFSLVPDVVGLTPNEECVIDMVYTAFIAESETGVGYSDSERVRLEFYAPAAAPEALNAFSLPEDTSPLLLEEETVTTSTEEAETPVVDIPPAGQTEETLLPIKPAAPDEAPEALPPAETVPAVDSTPEPAVIE